MIASTENISWLLEKKMICLVNYFRAEYKYMRCTVRGFTGSSVKKLTTTTAEKSGDVQAISQDPTEPHLASRSASTHPSNGEECDDR